MNEERDLIVGRVVEIGDVAALGNKPGIVIETTAEQLYAPGRSFAFCAVEIRLKDNDQVERPTSGTGVCECQNWANAGGDDAAQQMLTGHHPRCERGDFRKSALGLIADLAQALEEWGRQEDGIPDFAWEPYRRAQALQGVFLEGGGGV